jgi:excisionase family DNA binding protein
VTEPVYTHQTSVGSKLQLFEIDSHDRRSRRAVRVTIMAPDGGGFGVPLGRADALRFARAVINACGAERLMTPAEVADLFQVDPKTVKRWHDAGKIDAVRTLGGHRRFRASEVQALMDRTQEHFA